MTKTNYQDLNAAVIDRWVAEGWEWGKPIDHETFLRARAGDWQVKLTPRRNVPKGWFPDFCGKRVLGLACGGGQQMPVFSALGAACTVLDYSQRQLDSERMVARREGYEIFILRADMSKPLPFEDEAFDLIFHPVSNCYVEQVEPIWRECARVLKPGGLLLAGMDNGVNYMVDARDETRIVHRLPFNPLKDPVLMEELKRDDCGVQFSHSLDEQIGGQLKAGFILKDLYSDINGEGHLADLNIPTYIATLAVKA